MAEEPDEFEKQVVRNCPSDASYYFLLRYGENSEEIQFPKDRALKARGPFEHPIGCKPGDWLVIYTSDHLGHTKIQHVGSKPHVEVRLSLPRSVCPAPPPSATGPADQDLVEMLTRSQEAEDDADGSLKATRIDAKKREIALELAGKEQKLLLRSAKNKEIAEGFLLNRHHRLETREQSEAMYKLQNQSVSMIERNFVLMEKMQESFGRFAEIEKAAAQRLASPPPPVDYTPVLSSVVSAIRDIGVSAMQRDDRKKLKADEDSTPVKATLADKKADANTLESSSEKPSSALAATGSTPASTPAQPSMAELQARVEQMQAERDRLKSELHAERNRQHVLDEIHADAARGPRTALPAMQTRDAPRQHLAPRPPREPGSLFPRTASRNSGCPCGSGRPYKKCCMNKGRQAGQPHRTASAPESAPPVPAKSSSPIPSPANPVATVPGTSLVTSSAANPVAIVPGASLPPLNPSPANPVATVPGASLLPPDPSSPANPVATAPGASLPPPNPSPANPVAIAPGASLLPPDPSSPANPVATAPGASLAKSGTAEPQPLPTDASGSSSGPSPADPVATGPGASLGNDAPRSQPSTEAKPESQALPFELPPGTVSPELEELLVNMLAGKMLADPDAPIPPPLVAQVKQLEEVIVKPPKMDPETARKLLNDGSTMEAFGAFLFFNPLVRTILLNRRGK